MYICLDSVESCNLFNQHSDTDDSGVSWEYESESLNEALRRFNKNVETYPPLTDFRTGMLNFLSIIGFLRKLFCFNGLLRLGYF